MKCGGVGAVQDADDDVKSYCETVKDAIVEKLGKDVEMFTALKFQSQLVAGTNFFVKIQILESGECIHARIFRPLPHTGQPVSLHSLQTGKQIVDAIDYF